VATLALARRCDSEDVVDAVSGTLRDAQRAIWAEAARRGASYHVTYDTATEGGDDDGSPDFVVDDKSSGTWESYQPLSDAAWEQYRRQRAGGELRPISRSHAVGSGLPMGCAALSVPPALAHFLVRGRGKPL
jgi:hypothetical protein